MAEPDAKNEKGAGIRRPTGDKTIHLYLEQDDDITEIPSCCHVSPSRSVTFKSKLPFTVTFNIEGSPFQQQGNTYPGKPDSGPGPGAAPCSPPGPGHSCRLDMKSAPSLSPGMTFHYRVTLTDSNGPHHDCQCPTIIVGEMRKK